MKPVFIFDEAGNRLVTCVSWKEAETTIRELQEQGHNVLVAKDYEKESEPTPAISGKQLPISFIPGPWLDRGLVGFTYIPARENMRWRG